MYFKIYHVNIEKAIFLIKGQGELGYINLLWKPFSQTKFKPGYSDGLRKTVETYPGEKLETLMPSGFQRSCSNKPRYPL
jgi:hypothetical protein